MIAPPKFTATGSESILSQESGDQRPCSWWERLNARMNHDFCPWANRWVYWIKHPLAVLLLTTIIATVCAICLSPNVWFLVGTLVFVSVLGVVWPWIALRGINCQVEFLGTRIHLGTSVIVKVKLRNRAPWPIWGLSLVRGFEFASTRNDAVAFSRIPGWSEQEFKWEFLPSARGVYPLEKPAIESSFPFGLVTRRKPAAHVNELVVWPREAVLESLPDSANVQDHGTLWSDHRAGDCGDVLGTRPFRPGDSLRRVHWVQTARHRTMIVTERQAPIRTAVRITADLNADSHFRDGSVNTLELALSVMASVCRSLVKQNCYVECNLGALTFVPSTSVTELNRFRDALAAVPEVGYCESDETGEPAAGFSHKGCRDDLLHLRIEVAGAEHDSSISNRSSGSCKRIVVGEVPECSRRASPWIEIPLLSDALGELPRLWRRACHD